MNKFIMMAPKVIAVTFDQANDMKNKYLSAPKETKSAPVEHEVLNTSSPDLSFGSASVDSSPIMQESVVLQQPQQSFGQPAPVTENIFSTPTPEPVKEESPIVSAANDIAKTLTKSFNDLGEITLTEAELEELESGLTEILDIAKVSIKSVFDKYRSKNHEMTAQSNSINPAPQVNSNDNIFANESTNIFDSPASERRIS